MLIEQGLTSHKS